MHALLSQGGSRATSDLPVPTASQHADSLLFFLDIHNFCLPVESAEMAHVQDVLETEPDSDGLDIVYTIYLSGETSEGNDILICDCDHSTTVGYHQRCCVPPFACIPHSSWFCPECFSERRDVASELADPNYAPSSHPTTSASSTCSTSSSASESDSNSSSDSSNDTSSSDSDFSDVSSLTSASQSSVAAGGQGGALHLLNFFVAMGCSRN